MFKILRVNMTDLSVKSEAVPEAYRGLGGRGLTSAIISKEVEPTCSRSDRITSWSSPLASWEVPPVLILAGSR